jgi:hypothetical protein
LGAAEGIGGREAILEAFLEFIVALLLTVFAGSFFGMFVGCRRIKSSNQTPNESQRKELHPGSNTRNEGVSRWLANGNVNCLFFACQAEPLRQARKRSQRVHSLGELSSIHWHGAGVSQA